MEVISLDESRVQILDDCVKKKSGEQEVESLRLAKNLSCNFDPFVIHGERYKLAVPEIYDYHQGVITMEKCVGDNLELTLRTLAQHKKGVEYTNELLKLFLKKSFYWHDFAPRNIMVDDDKIWIMDFERGLSTKERLSLYFLNNVYEEYSAFLLPEERKYNLEKIIRRDRNKMIKVKDLTSTRVKEIVEVLFGRRAEITIQEYYEALNVILKAERPYRKEDEIIYPLIELEEYMHENGREEYVKKVVRNYYGKH
ncbi:MAG: hypothetical protein J6X28_05820 [Bacilli bacterium]|nr:hypothetical protein [Bacilli bacterium]